MSVEIPGFRERWYRLDKGEKTRRIEIDRGGDSDIIIPLASIKRPNDYFYGMPDTYMRLFNNKSRIQPRSLTLVTPDDSRAEESIFDCAAPLVVFCGGSHLGPIFGEANSDDLASIYAVGESYDEQRDWQEKKIFKMCVDGKIPFVGICRGLQLTVAGKTGIMPETLNSNSHRLIINSEPQFVRHKILLTHVGAELATYNGISIPDDLTLMSNHNQGYLLSKRIYEEFDRSGIEVLGSSEDGVVEMIAVSVDDRILGIACQGHPERDETLDGDFFRSLMGVVKS